MCPVLSLFCGIKVEMIYYHLDVDKDLSVLKIADVPCLTATFSIGAGGSEKAIL